jgi:cyclophilin family peptidyl-prolyl cis-trans isomerase
MRLRHWPACALLCGLLTGGLPAVVLADPPAAPDAASNDSGKSQDPLKEWAALTAERDKLGEKFKKLFEQFKTADDQQKQTLIPELEKMQRTYMTQIQPQIIKLAPAVYAKDPKNAEAATIVLALAYEANDYAKVIRLAEPILKSEKPDPLTLNMAGVSYFASMDFAKAQELLTLASKAEPRLYAQLGERFAQSIPEYIGFWKKEQEIRAREAKANDLPRVMFKTNRGDIELELFENEAPNAVANFINLVEKGFYNGTTFHRVMPNFMAQGGDPNSKNDDPSDDGMGGPGYNIACECYQENARKHFQGSLSMAHAGKDTGGSQFFLTHMPTPHLNASAAEQKGHTVFGRVIKGQEIALALKIGDKIISAKVVRKRDHKYEPEKLPERKMDGLPPRLRLDKRPAKKVPSNDE